MMLVPVTSWRIYNLEALPDEIILEIPADIILF